ncbi:MAG: MFS transporter [Acidimicrobiia bacterium]
MTSAPTDAKERAHASAHALRVLVPAQFALSLGYGVLFALLAQLQDAHGLPTAGLGLISGATFLTSLAAQLGLARYADRGHTKALLYGGLGAATLALVWIGTASTLWEFVLARSIEGFAIGCFVPAARAWLVSVDPDRMGRNLGYLGAFDVAGVTLGPLLGAVVAANFGLRAPFYVLAALTLVAFVAVMAGRPATGRRDGSHHDTHGGIRTLVRIKPVLAGVVLTVALEFPVGIYDSLWSRLLTDLGASTAFIGVGLALFGLPYMLLTPIGGRLCDRFGALRISTWAFVLIVPTTLAYGLFKRPGLITAMAVLEAVGGAFAFPGTQAAVAQDSPPHLLATGQGLALAAGIGAAGAAAFVAPLVYEHAGSGWLFGAAAALMAVLVGIAVVLARRR